MDQMLAAGLPQVTTVGGTALPLAGRARVYACGITPYDVTHLGHAATFVWVDTLARVLHADGTEVIVCRNVTDVDDVLLAAANRDGSPYSRFAVIQQFYFDQDMAALGVRSPALQPRAHAYIGQVIALAAGLLAREAAYQRDGQVYFRGGAAARRAGLDRQVALRLAAEYGDHPDDARKDDPFDVAVWQRRRYNAGREGAIRCRPSEFTPSTGIDNYPRSPWSAQQVCSAGAGDLLEGELPDLGWQGHVAVGGGVGLAVVGEPVEHSDQRLPGGLAGLAGVDQRPAVPADGVAAGAGLVDDGEAGRGDAGFLGGGGDGLGGRADVVSGLVADFGERQDQALRVLQREPAKTAQPSAADVSVGIAPLHGLVARFLLNRAAAPAPLGSCVTAEGHDPFISTKAGS